MPASTSEELIATIKDKEARKRVQKRLAAARARSVLEHDFPKLAAIAGQAPTIKDNPPLIYHPREEGEEDLLTRARAAFAELPGIAAGRPAGAPRPL